MLNFEDLPTKAPGVFSPETSKTWAKTSISSSIGSSFFCILPAQSPKNAPSFKRDSAAFIGR